MDSSRPGGTASSGDVGSDEDNEPFINSDVTALFARWRNEKYAPELLPFDAVVVENISELVENAGDILEEERLGGGDDQDSSFRDPNDPDYCLRCMDMERIKYLLRDYLRIRLWKLGRWPQHYLEPLNSGVLSDAERRFLGESWAVKSGFLDNRLLCVLPPFKQGLADKVDLTDMVRKPELHRHVYARILRDLGKLEAPSSRADAAAAAGQPSATAQPPHTSASAPEPLVLVPGQSYLLRYSVIRDFLMLPQHAGKVELI